MMQYSILFLMVIAFAQVNAEETAEDLVGKNAKCGTNLTKVIDKVEFNQKNASISCNFTIVPKSKNVTEIHIMLERMVLDDDDTLTIKTIPSTNESAEVIFGPFHARPDAIILITGLKELVIELNTSSRVVQREFAASYHAQACTFTVNDNVPVVGQPIYAPNITSGAPCEYLYNVKVDPNVTFAFSFDAYNLSGTSNIAVDGAAEFSSQTFGKDSIPVDFLSGTQGQVKLMITMDPEKPSDHFALRRHQAYSACSGLEKIDGQHTVKSPSLPKLIDQDVPLECHWHFKSENSNEALGVKFHSINLENNFDIVTITDGPRASFMPLLQVTRSTQNTSLAQVVRSTSSELIFAFKPESFQSNITFDIISAGSGKYLKGNGTFKGSSLADRANDTVFLLEVPEGKSVVVNFKSYSLTSPAALEIYEDFTTESRKIATLKSDVWYPVMSSTSKLMIAAINFVKGEFEGEFEPATEGCIHMSPSTSDSYVLSGNCNSTCTWIIPPVDYKGVLLLDLQYLALGKDDTVTVLHLDKNKTVMATITSKTSHIPQLSLDTAVGAFVNVTRGACSKTDEVVLVARANYLPDCSQSYTLAPDDELRLTSPSYPDTYPLFSHCKSNIKPFSKNQKLHLAFDKLELASDHCIQISYASENGSSSFQVTGNQMPDDLIVSGEVNVLFNSGSCNTTKGVSTYVSKQGFLLNLTAINCGGVVTDKTGKFTIPVNTSLCIYKVTVPASETDGSVNIIIYSTEEGKLGNYKLYVHDGSTVRDGLINNSTNTNIWSHTNSLIFVYKRENSTKTSADVTIKYTTKSCDQTMQCENGICMHPDWRCDGKNDCGDYSDEKNCESQPPQPLEEKGISPVAFGICIILFFVLGVTMTLCAPWALQKYRNRYRPFQDLSVIE